MKLRSDQFRNARARRHRRQPTSEKSRLRTVRPAHQPRRFKTNGHLPNDVGRNCNGRTIALSCSYYVVKAWPFALYAICTTCATCSSAGGGGSSGSGSGNGSGVGSGSDSKLDPRPCINNNTRPVERGRARARVSARYARGRAQALTGRVRAGARRHAWAHSRIINRLKNDNTHNTTHPREPRVKNAPRRFKHIAYVTQTVLRNKRGNHYGDSAINKSGTQIDGLKRVMFEKAPPPQAHSRVDLNKHLIRL